MSTPILLPPSAVVSPGAFFLIAQQVLCWGASLQVFLGYFGSYCARHEDQKSSALANILPQ